MDVRKTPRKTKKKKKQEFAWLGSVGDFLDVDVFKRGGRPRTASRKRKCASDVGPVSLRRLSCHECKHALTLGQTRQYVDLQPRSISFPQRNVAGRHRTASSLLRQIVIFLCFFPLSCVFRGYCVIFPYCFPHSCPYGLFPCFSLWLGKIHWNLCLSQKIIGSFANRCLPAANPAIYFDYQAT